VTLALFVVFIQLFAFNSYLAGHFFMIYRFWAA